MFTFVSNFQLFAHLVLGESVIYDNLLPSCGEKQYFPHELVTCTEYVSTSRRDH